MRQSAAFPFCRFPVNQKMINRTVAVIYHFRSWFSRYQQTRKWSAVYSRRSVVLRGRIRPLHTPPFLPMNSAAILLHVPCFFLPQKENIERPLIVHMISAGIFTEPSSVDSRSTNPPKRFLGGQHRPLVFLIYMQYLFPSR